MFPDKFDGPLGGPGDRHLLRVPEDVLNNPLRRVPVIEIDDVLGPAFVEFCHGEPDIAVLEAVVEFHDALGNPLPGRQFRAEPQVMVERVLILELPALR